MKDRDYEALALSFIQSKSTKEWAEKNNISLATARRIKNEPGFESTLNEVRQKTFSKAMTRAQILCDDAITELHRMGMDENTPATAKVSALKGVIDASLSSFDIKEIEPLLNKIRQMGSDENCGNDC